MSVHLCHEDITVVIEMQLAPVELKQMKGRPLTSYKLIRGTAWRLVSIKCNAFKSVWIPMVTKADKPLVTRVKTT